MTRLNRSHKTQKQKRGTQLIYEEFPWLTEGPFYRKPWVDDTLYMKY